jgi:transposase
LEAALGERIGVSDEEWSLVGPLLPAEHGRGCRPAGDNRRYFEGMMWNSVFRRYRRWIGTGVFDAMLETLAELAGRERSADMIDSTVVRAHHCAVGIKRGLKSQRRLVDRAAASPPSFTPAATAGAARSASC